MILVCDDFEYDKQKLSDKGLVSVNFESDTTLPSSIKREMDSSTMNKYRPETVGLGIKYTEVLTFDIHIGKNFCNMSQSQFEMTPEEYDEIAAWLSSPQTNMWMNITTHGDKKTKVKGYFSSVVPYDYAGTCYGLVCTFTCNSPFSYTEKTVNQTITTMSNFMLNNASSDLYDFVYPMLTITPTKNEDIFIHNMSDSKTLDSGTISVVSNKDTNMQQIVQKIESYASLNSLKVAYIYDSNEQFVQYICDKTAILFYMTDNYGIKNKYVAYYLESNGQYYICQGGFFYCKLLRDLPIVIDCKNLGVYDALNRPVLFDTLGIQDEDEIYWLRLIHGYNSFRVKGTFSVEVYYLEPRKGMLV